MRRRTSASLALPLVMTALLAGCGGSGNDNNGTKPNPDANVMTVRTGVDVTWSGRSREFVAPSAALSARITFVGGSAAGADVTTVANRRDGPAQYTTTYALPTPVRTGGATIRVDFYAGKDAGGALVASAESGAIVKADGTISRASGEPLGFLVGQSEIASVTLVGPTSITADETVQYGFTALNRQGQAIALTPGSALFSANGGLQSTPDGKVSARFNSPGQVSVTVDGTTDTKDVTVTQATNPAIVVLDQPANTVAYSASRNRVLITTPGSGANPNSLLTLDPATGALDGVYRVGSAPGALGVSADGNVVYVGLDGSAAIRRVDISTGAVGAPFSLGNSSGSTLTASDIAVSPSDPDTIAVAQGSSSFDRSLVLYRGGVAAPDRVNGFYQNTLLAFASDGASVFGIALGISSNELTRNSVGPNGVVQVASVDNRLSGDVLASEGRVYGLNGQVIAADTLTPVGRFETTERFPIAFTISPATRRAYFLLNASGDNLTLQTFDLDTFALVTTQTVPNATSNFTGRNFRRLAVAGPNRLAYIDSGKLFLIDLTKL